MQAPMRFNFLLSTFQLPIAMTSNLNPFDLTEILPPSPLNSLTSSLSLYALRHNKKNYIQNHQLRRRPHATHCVHLHLPLILFLILFLCKPRVLTLSSLRCHLHRSILTVFKFTTTIYEILHDYALRS